MGPHRRQGESEGEGDMSLSLSRVKVKVRVHCHQGEDDGEVDGKRLRARCCHHQEGKGEGTSSFERGCHDLP